MLFFLVDTIDSRYFSHCFTILQTICHIMYSIVIVLLMLGTLVIMFRFGKKFLKSTGNFAVDFLSLLPWHILILVLLFFAISFEPTLVLLVTWPCLIFEKMLIMDIRILLPDLSGSFITGAILSFVPYIVMFCGLSKKRCEETE